ncbi:MAG TPA: hypothetical protein VK461_06435 [Acidimicrobiales bacterium]|nr:hypothetical protein [Acidimicrobiales bacterium]
MAVFNAVFPVLPGKEDAARAFAAETVGPRRADYDAHLTRVQTTRETWALQDTPMGSFMLVWFEGDVEKSFADLATNDSEFIAWFRAQVLDVTGFDLAAPPEGPPPAILVDWHA